MLEQLDPHFNLYIIEGLGIRRYECSIERFIYWNRIRFQIFKDTVLIVQAIPGGPSEKVGLMAGDKIIKIGEEMVDELG